MKTTLTSIQSITMAIAVCFLIALTYSSSPAGDSLVGKVTAVKRANLITLDYGAGTYDIRISGIEIEKDEAVSRQATQAMSSLLLGKRVRLRFDGALTVLSDTRINLSGGGSVVRSQVRPDSPRRICARSASSCGARPWRFHSTTVSDRRSCPASYRGRHIRG